MPGWKDYLQSVANRLGYRFERIAEPKEITLLRAVMQLRGIDLVVDVGAHRGEFATVLRQKVGYAGPLLSVEPNPECAVAIRAASAPDPHWEFVNAAMGDESVTLPFSVASRTTFSSFLEPSGLLAERFASSMAPVRTIPVHVHRLDRLIPERIPDWRARRILLKSDTQGFDSRVLRGAIGILDAVHIIQVELAVQRLYRDADPYHVVLAALDDMGFAPVDFSVVVRAENSILEMDGLFQRMHA